MEFLPSLPADFVAAADPSARGAASLLRPPGSEGQASSAAVPFELCLARLTTGLPGGESWPASGKELPLELQPVAADVAATVAPGLLSGVMPVAVADAAPQGLRLMESPPKGISTEALPVTLPSNEPKLIPVALPSAPGGEPAAAADALTPPAAAHLEPITALATAEAELAPLEGIEPASAAAKSALAASWLESLTHERRLQRPTSAAPADLRAAASSAATIATSAAQTPLSVIAATPAADAPQVVQGALRHIELPKLLAPGVTVGGEGTLITQPEWLPPATHGSATSATAATAAVPGAPVDLRSPNGPETFAHRVQWLVDQQVGEAHIKLNPPELGTVDVKISLVDDKTYVQLTTATAAARDELSQSLPRLRELFTVSGLELGGASVHSGRDGRHAGQGYGAHEPDPRPFAPFSADGGDMPTLLPRRTLGRIDVFA